MQHPTLPGDKVGKVILAGPARRVVGGGQILFGMPFEERLKGTQAASLASNNSSIVVMG